jgi:carboxymethylenebutenolidase
MSDWVNSVADRLAAEGFIALAPDMITGQEGNATGLVRALTKEQIVERLNVVREHGLSLPAANGKLGCVGFCWGGSSSWLYATAQPELGAAVVYYGTAPTNEELAAVKAPTLGLFGENDARVNVTRPRFLARADRGA